MPFAARRLTPVCPVWTSPLASVFGAARAAATVACLLGGHTGLASEAGTGTLESCLAAVVDAGTPEISCTYLALLNEEERADMQRLSRGLLQDARCSVKVRIARSLVTPALTLPNHVFEAPPQPVHCDIKTKSGGFQVEGTFAPRVVFKNGLAAEATPLLANVTGINRYLAWPLVQYVNRSGRIRDGMIAIINAMRPKLADAVK